MKKYPKYKPSEIDWIGDIPEHWEIRKLGNIGIFSSSGIDKKIVEGEPLVNMINYTDIYGNSKKILNSNRNYMVVSCPAEKQEKHQIKKGDLLFTPSSETIEDIGLSALVDEDLENTVFSYHVIRFEFSKEVSHAFKKYICNNHMVLNSFSKKAKGTTRQILGREDFKTINVILPEFDEQTVIANFLDRKTAEIDDLISKKQKLIDLLNEEKTAVINHAVTKGIDPNVKMKDSGIPWLGDIPEHWKIKKLKYLSYKITDGEHIAPSFTLQGMPFLSAKDVQDDNIIFSDDKFVSVEDGKKFRKRCNPEKNDILLVSRGATIGRVAIVDTEQEFCLLGSVILIKPKENIESKYFLYSMKNKLLQNYFLLTSQSSAQQAIYLINIVDVTLALPEIMEQKKIVTYIDNKLLEINVIINKEQRQIDLLNEYRSTLINESVTGKIDVRGY